MTPSGDELALDGLDGSNPMGFLAGLGVLAVLATAGRPGALGWSDEVVPRARLAGWSSLDALVDVVLEDRDRLRQAPLLAFPSVARPASDVKFEPEELTAFLAACRASEPSASLSAALVCELSVDNKGRAKPTDLHFMAGQQQFLDTVRELRDALAPAHLQEALAGPWSYEHSEKSFMWDLADDRDYAFTATKPAKTKKMTVPGADWLAFRGLALLPVVPGRGRTLTPATGGSWKEGSFTWPVWGESITAPVARSLMQQMPRVGEFQDDRLLAWGVHRIYQSRITRSDKGGLATIRPSLVLWSSTGAEVLLPARVGTAR